VEDLSLVVIKKDKRREEFNRHKLLSGVRKACEKRPLPVGTIEKIADDIESELRRMGRAEVSSSVVGEMVMERLRGLDHIAYIRFASVYRAFADIGSLKQEVDTLVSGSQLPLLPKAELNALGKAGRGDESHGYKIS
jgi:transcriptional repressor NrdR